MPKKQYATFAKLKYLVETDKVLDGYVDLPGEPDSRVLHINGDLGPKAFLETAIHEALHAATNNDDESYVDPVAKDIAKFLWQLGYRREKKQH